MTRRWSLRVLAGLVVSLAVLTGCAAKQEANDSLPTASSTPTEEALAPLGPEDLPMPAEARTQDPAGAEAFVRYFVELLNHQQAIPAGGPIRELAPHCDDCLRIAQRLDEAADKGYRVQGGELSIVGSFGTTVREESVEISFIARVEAVVVRDASGHAVPETQYAAQDRLPSGIGLVWSDTAQSWLVSGLTIG